MRKLTTLSLLSFVLVVSAGAQNCIVYGADWVGNFIACANNPATTSIDFGPPPSAAGYGTISVVGTDPAVDLSGITINVPDKMSLQLSGNIIFDAATNFQGSGGNVRVQIGTSGTVYKGIGNNDNNPNNDNNLRTFTYLNNLIVSCSADPSPMECLEIQAFLPVELTAFSGQVRDRKVNLQWETATELNNDYFAVEHSADGLRFSAIGKVRGGGTSSEPLRYSFVHRLPVAGANYYRLRQVDYNGAYEYSDMIAVEVSSRGTAVEVFPNPTTSQLFIRPQERPERMRLQLTNLLGQQIDILPQLNGQGWELDLNRLANGIYFLRLEIDGKTITRRVVKE